MNSIQQNDRGITEQIPYGTGTIHHNLDNLTPTASEIGFLWNSYLAETMALCFLKKWTKESTDPEIHGLLQYTLDMTTERVAKIVNLFNSVKHPIPTAFGEKDVDINAPQLFYESFTSLYVRMMQVFIMIQYAAASAVSYRTDFKSFFSESMRISNDIEKRATEILLAKGILQKHPSILTPHSIGNVNDKKYYGSYFRIFGQERPLNAIEITHIYT